MPKRLTSALPKWDVIHGSWSLISLVGSPNHRYMCWRYSCVIPGPVMVVSHGRKIVTSLSAVSLHAGVTESPPLVRVCPDEGSKPYSVLGELI
jgi:hypothetical protein